MSTNADRFLHYCTEYIEIISNRKLTDLPTSLNVPAHPWEKLITGFRTSDVVFSSSMLVALKKRFLVLRWVNICRHYSKMNRGLFFAHLSRIKVPRCFSVHSVVAILVGSAIV